MVKNTSVVILFSGLPGCTKDNTSKQRLLSIKEAANTTSKAENKSRSGGIRMGRGSNSIRWLTVLGNPSTNALSAIDTDLTWQCVIHIRAAHLVVKGSQNGINIRNPGFTGINRVIEAEIENNEFVENTVGAGQGIEIQNANGATGSIIRARMKENYSHGNRVGLRSFNTANNSASITIVSTDDRFENNGTRCWLAAGASTSATTIANGNTLNFEAHGTSIRNNQRNNNPDGTPPAGLFAAAGLSALNANSTSDNRLKIALSRSPLAGNYFADINAFGADSSTPDLAGTNNITEIYMDDYNKEATTIIAASLPAEPAGTNVIKIFR
jgi:hypothetical protein